MLSIINNDYELEIQNYSFQLDLKNDNVIVSQVLDTKKKSFGKEEVLSANTNVLAKYFDPSNYSEDTKLKFFIGNDKDAEYNVNTSKGDVKMKVVYQKAGVYFSLQSKIKFENLSSGGAVMLGLYSIEGNKYSRKNDSSDKLIGEHYDGGYGREYNYRPYNGWLRGLDKYLFTVIFGIQDDQYGTYQEYTLQIIKGY